ncbi:TPA: rod shape-determining protein [bacterium]|nr:MAG: rod shape-determining protein [Candidatus Hydrogenedentes bacterium CG1_02_42_14]PIU48684.1 MAG: rod shape-determining protein [Candidatus Hydrogenedentes bacterium CG07_land_8_20_14_0_80_42_17]HBW47353.1 rod shape-determining protein [bacterium]
MTVLNKVQTLWRHFSNDMGIDLGTANTLVYVEGRGIVLREPSVVALKDNEILAVGAEAKLMVGRTPAAIRAIRPMRDGVISDFAVAEKMIRYFIQKVHNRRTLVAPRIVIGVPSGITEVEKRAVRESALQAGASQVWLIEECIAAAIGCDMSIEEPVGNMIVTIGGGTSEVAVISLGDIVVARSLRVAGDKIDEAIMNYMRRVHNLQIGDRTAEEIKIEIGNVYPSQDDLVTKEVRGRDYSGMPMTVTVTAGEIREAMMEPVSAIVDSIRQTLENTPPELAGDIMQKGIVVAGGGALIRGLQQLLHDETGLPITIAEDPLSVVALGTGKYLLEIKGSLRKAV